MSQLLTMLTPNAIMYLILAVVAISIFIFLWFLNRDKKSLIDFTDLVTINGKLNERKFTRFGSWIVSTWGFVYLIVDGKLTDSYFLTYISVWTANALIGKSIDIKKQNADESER